MIVVYPDIWFETDGAGSGFKLIEDVTCFETHTEQYAVLVDLPYVKVDVLRPAVSVPPNRILESVRGHIAFKYPSLIEFIPLLLPLRPFPRLSRGLVAFFSGPSADVGGYCSQIVSRILTDLYSVSVAGQDDHISPGVLRQRLIKSSAATKVDCTALKVPDGWKRSSQLQDIYRNLLKVTSRLRSYQYPHDRASFETALANTFKEEGIDGDPKKFAILAASLRNTLTKPDFFRLHELVWAGKYT